MLSENVSKEYHWTLEKVKGGRQVTWKDEDFELQMEGKKFLKVNFLKLANGLMCGGFNGKI